ncbi:MAG: aminopeptidase N, partial [Actinomycetota bacterium]|nr:aminopeptidase N [Actinomycetota bacterium]
MSSTVDNLHRSQAAERARLLHVDGYLVELDLTTGDSSFRSRTVVSFGCTEPGASTFVNLTASAVTEITLNGRRLDPGEVFDGNRLTLPALASDNELTVVADCPYMRTGEGLHRFVDPVDGSVYLYTQFETFDAHRMYACFDQPDLKATFTLTVTAPPAWTVVSNMDVPSGPEPADSGARVWRFAPSPRMSTYITALVAGPYVSVRDTYEGPNGVIPLGIYCRASLAEYLKPDELFEVTKQGFDFFHRVFDYPYPFGKYDQLFVPEFNAGAMENAGCVTFLEDYVFRSKVTAAAYERRAETVLHEMAHMWFGDLVTMRWWDDLWLNESFATYMAVLSQAEATKYRNAWTTFANAEKTWAYRQDQLSSTHPIAAEIEDIDAVEVNFDGITYAKGASVLRQLVAWVGQEEFFRGVRAYFRRHEYGNTTLSDLLGALEQTSGRVLGSWAAEWLETTGVNTLRARFDTDDAGRFTSFAVEQTAVPEHPTLRSHRVAIGLYNRTTDGLVRTRRVETDVVGASTDVPELIGVARPDLVLINDDDLTYAKIRLDERSLATLTTSIGEFRESLPRALCWTAVWDMTRDAELAGRDYIRQVLSGIDRETDIGMVQTLLRQAKATADLYVDPAHRLTVVTALRDAARRAMFAAPGASDRQLAWTRAYAWFATDQDDASTLRGILDGSVVVDGLTVDAELRWSLLGRLAALGAA